MNQKEYRRWLQGKTEEERRRLRDAEGFVILGEEVLEENCMERGKKGGKVDINDRRKYLAPIDPICSTVDSGKSISAAL
ncbi:hypothetical protein [Fusicatenibacter saccharivorans]|mgnify:FL=1|uniref:hypothetical protein n=1 Tax=Lachnospiraceae TaxID=186803 RepID=UPI003CFF9C5F